MKKSLHLLSILCVVTLWVALAVAGWFSPRKDISLAERRPLQQLPTVDAQSLLSGSFMDKFEKYTLDQFPLRDSFRRVKSLFVYNVLHQKDNNGIYIENGFAAKLEYPLQQVSVNNAVGRFRKIYETYLRDTNCHSFLTVVPDKGYYLAEAGGYPAMDYEQLFSQMQAGLPWAQYVDITGSLGISDYYATDTHWRQERLWQAAAVLRQALGVRALQQDDYTPVLATNQFLGVYYGQAALPLKPEKLYILESDLLQDCRVYNHETKAYTSLYDLHGLAGYDPYDVFLGGAQALLTIENPRGEPGRELILFRDSFGSALAPLLTEGYSRITLVDTRYISTDRLGEYIDFRGQDVLFVYSTLILNNSAVLK